MRCTSNLKSRSSRCLFRFFPTVSQPHKMISDHSLICFLYFIVAAIEGWADLDNNLPPILSGISFPFVDEDIHRYNHIGNLDHNDHSTTITSTYPTSTEPDVGMHVNEHAEMAPKCTPLSWMHHQKAEASPKCVPLSWMHAKDQPSEKAHAAHGEVLDLLPPFSLPLSLPLSLNEDVGKLYFHSHCH